MIIIPQPTALRGTPEEKIAAMQKYLTELSEILSVSLNSMNYTSFDDETRKMIKGG